MSFPWKDAQFWIVTAIFVGAAIYLLRNVLPLPGRVRAKRGEKKATLTISAKPGGGGVTTETQRHREGSEDSR